MAETACARSSSRRLRCASRYVLVVPEDPTDKLYTNWSKTGSIGGTPIANPVVNNTGDDPSTAWKLNGDEHAEWRIIGNQACQPQGGNPVYGSKDFVNWYKVGCSTLMAGDCPTFFPLPKLYPGTERYLDAHGPLPNHAHKSGGRGGDQFQVGSHAPCCLSLRRFALVIPRILTPVATPATTPLGWNLDRW